MRWPASAASARAAAKCLPCRGVLETVGRRPAAAAQALRRRRELGMPGVRDLGQPVVLLVD